ncbi:hypothetical protein A2721_00355 [Candidatus Gottesmanbacteria bacterium RIFCSPHIGHO2_01_FULL_47_48]|uniref:BioF2-like acetyltransferase domain-containing protein n=1 Tax=Candidatus Gottesmanbacteria bacterium RIFCSPHIGHO2_01_FULL_47_48 TaxID=1798381 RepID=A0A1F6A1A0_9BACT|nr:MAG: hypothetical protein A2721_00355 [Candidatus Gottesmanbacteria bacterium RIFCSPHIGHO2_01_FULL_47_48]
MKTQEITDKKIWENFVTSQEDYTFLQSWSWGEFQKSQGEKVWRVGMYGKQLIGVCQVFTVSAKRGKFLFVPHGPLKSQISPASPRLDRGRAKLKTHNFLQFIVDFLKDLAIKEKCSFIRISPWVEVTEENREAYRQLGFRDAPTIMHAEETWLIPISGSEEEILAGMRKTHRNLVRRAGREGVEIEIIRDVGGIGEIGELYDLQLEAAKRHGFVPFSQKYLEMEFETFAKDGQCALFLGKHQGETLAAAVIVFYGKFAFYLQSGSKTTNVPVNYALQWEVIAEAKRRGCEIYNMWGVSAENRANEQGLLMFKSGFGGFRKNYLHAQDLVLSPKYWITWGLEKVPRKWRSKI